MDNYKDGDKLRCKRDLKSPIDGRIYFRNDKVYEICHAYPGSIYFEIEPENEGLSGDNLFSLKQVQFYFYTHKEMRKLKIEAINKVV